MKFTINLNEDTVCGLVLTVVAMYVFITLLFFPSVLISTVIVIVKLIFALMAGTAAALVVHYLFYDKTEEKTIKHSVDDEEYEDEDEISL